mgnify:CR=1 FL=1
MAVLRKEEIKKLNRRELHKKLRELRLELAKERANINIGASANSPGRIKEMRRAVSRILTAENETKEEKGRNG